MRTIAIPVADRKECTFALETAFELGVSLGANVVGYHVLPSLEELNQINRAELWAGAAMAYPIWTAGDEAEIKKAAGAAETLFKRQAEKNKYEVRSKLGTPDTPYAVFETRKGAPERLFTGIGPVSDMIVVSRPPKNGGQKAHAIMLSALMDAATPVLLLPQEKTRVTGKNIVIAWNGREAEALLVHLTLPLLRNAGKVTFATIGEQEGKGATGEDMTAYLAAHGIKARAVTVKGRNAGKALEQAVSDAKADLLLSGAYSRGRMREMVFGGVTEYLVNNSNTPVLMLHV